MSNYYGDDEDLGARMEADSMMASLEARARREERLRAKGICSHGWLRARPLGCHPMDEEQAAIPDGGFKCYHCGHVGQLEEIGR